MKNNKKVNNTLTPKRMALLGLLVCGAMLTFMLESLLPPLIIPGAKLGFANVFTLITIIILSPIEAVILLCIRTVLTSLILGNPFAIVYSLSAGLVSLFFSIILIKFLPKISIISISIVGAVVHNIVQNIVFCAINSTLSMLALLPYLSLIGVFSGCIVGVLVYLILHKIPISFFAKHIENIN